MNSSTENNDVDRQRDEICQSMSPDGLAESQDGADLIYDPWVVERPGGRVEIWGKRDNPDIIPWGFWGGVVAAVMAVIIVFGGSSGQISLWDVFWASTVLCTGLVLFRLGRRSTLEEDLLCEVDTRHQLLSWPTEVAGTAVAVAFDEIEELSFSATRVPVKESRAGTHLDAVVVSIRDGRGRELPVVPASTSKAETHRIARLLADLLGISVDYVGTGVREWA